MLNIEKREILKRPSVQLKAANIRPMLLGHFSYFVPVESRRSASTLAVWRPLVVDEEDR